MSHKCNIDYCLTPFYNIKYSYDEKGGINMKKAIILSSLICVILLTGCTFKLPFGGKAKPKPSGEVQIEVNTNQTTQITQNTTNSSSNYFDETFVIALDETPTGSEEILDSFIDFDEDGSFYAYIGFTNGLYGTYTVDNNNITCLVNKCSNEYSPNQETSATITLNKDFAILTVLSASPSYHVKTTNMDENGEWVFDGGEKDIALTSFTPGNTYTLYMPIDY